MATRGSRARARRVQTPSRRRATGTRRSADARPRTAGPSAGRSFEGSADLERKTRKELLELATRAGVRGRHRLVKSELIRQLMALGAHRPAASRAQAQDRRKPVRTSPVRTGAIVSLPAPAEAPPSKPTESSPAHPITETVQRAAPPSEPTPERLPSRYGITEVVALPVDPILVYLYWELTPEAIAGALAALGGSWEGATQTLRAYDVAWIEFDGSNAHRHFDVDVQGDVGNWYVHLWSPEQTLMFEIGWRSRDGRFVAAARSNLVQTPRNAPCEGGEERWMTITEQRATPTPAESIPKGSGLRETERVTAAQGHSGALWPAPHSDADLSIRKFQR